jgi:glycosyltransferase involved in cell wall biosynthesis
VNVLAVVPAYNEAEAIGDVVRELRARGDVDVLVVDDGSEDGTAEVARAAGARVVVLPFNLGIGGAVQTGFLFARERAYDAAVQVDGDGQHPAREIDRLLAPLVRGEADVVIGSRFGADAGFRSPPLRRVGMRVFSAIVSAVTGRSLHDTTSGFRATGRRAIEFLAEHYPADYPEVEALVLLCRADFRVVETPCSFRGREIGRSSITAGRSVYYAIKVLLAIFVGMFRRVPPAGEGRAGSAG